MHDPWNMCHGGRIDEGSEFRVVHQNREKEKISIENRIIQISREIVSLYHCDDAAAVEDFLAKIFFTAFALTPTGSQP